MSQPTRPVADMVDFSGGLNSAEPPDTIGPTQVAEIRNLEYRRTHGLRRRRGSQKNITGALPFAAGSTVVSLCRHTPGQSEISMELWGISNDVTPELARLAANAGLSQWAPVVLPDAIVNAAAAWFFRGVSFNGKFFLFYDSPVDRLHVWDGATVRRAGLSQPPAGPTVANTGAGAYAAIPRFYKVSWAIFDSPLNTALVWGPPSAATSFTPSGAGTAARISRPALSGDGETTWQILASSDGVNYYLIAGLGIGTLTFDDSTAPALYPTLSPAFAGLPTGADYYTAPISAKFGMVDGAQLLLGGSWKQTPRSSTVFFTPALGTTGLTVTDDERVPTTNRIELDPQLGGGITGMGGPIGGTPVVFKIERTYLLNPTADPTRPYTRQLLSDAVGCVAYQGIVMAEDENGSPSLYWPSRRGVYRYGSGGLEYCSADIEDLWATVNFSAVNGISATYHRDAGQVWMYLPIGTNPQPTVLVKFHVSRGRRTEEGVRGGWTRADGNLALCSAVGMFSDSLAAYTLRLKPYVAANGSGGEVYRADSDFSNRDDDNLTPFIASILSRAVSRGLGQQFGIQNVYVQGISETFPVVLNVSIRRNFDPADTIPPITIALQPQRGVLSAAGLELSECEAVQIRVSEQAALDQHWAIDRLGVRVRDEAPKE